LEHLPLLNSELKDRGKPPFGYAATISRNWVMYKVFKASDIDLTNVVCENVTDVLPALC
jgi:hypothetical protein